MSQSIRRSTRRPVSPRARLQLQSLEERAVPTVFTVTNTADSGTGSLRAAITAADADTTAPHTINFSNSTAGGNTNFYDGTAHTITLATALPNLARDMTIQGPGAGGLTITGYAAAVRVFNQTTPNLTISGMTLTGRIAGGGAGVNQTAVNENLTISNSVIAGSSASGPGVVSNLAGGTVSISGTSVSNNTTEGGALWVNQSPAGGAALNILNSQVLNNVSTGPGGAVSFYFGGTLTIDHSTIAGNSTSGTGGAVYVWGYPAGSTTISSSTIANNTAAGGGGAVFLGTGTNNTAVTSTTITGNVGLTAGAIDNASAATITLDNAILSGNTAGGVPEVASSHAVTVSYSALDTLAGMTAYTDNGGNLSQADSTPAALALQPLASATGPNGTFGVIRLNSGSTAVDAGDPAQGGSGHTDELGTPRPQGAGVDIGAVEALPPHVVSVVVGDGTAERSEVRQLVVTFDTAVTFSGGNSNAAAAFQLEHVSNFVTPINIQVNNLQAAVSANSSGQTVVTLTFSTAGNGAQEVDPVSAQNGGQPSLNDGMFQLTIFAAHVGNANGQLAGNGTAVGTNYVSSTTSGPNGLGVIYRRFGDTTGDGLDDLSDLAAFRGAYATAVGSPAYVSFLDADNSGAIDLIDLAEFRKRYN
jgi:hypothetical protein